MRNAKKQIDFQVQEAMKFNWQRVNDPWTMFCGGFSWIAF